MFVGIMGYTEYTGCEQERIVPSTERGILQTLGCNPGTPHQQLRTSSSPWHTAFVSEPRGPYMGNRADHAALNVCSIASEAPHSLS